MSFTNTTARPETTHHRHADVVRRLVHGLMALVTLSAIAFANDLTLVNEVAAIANAKIVEVRPAAALLDATRAGRDAQAVRARLDGAVLHQALDIEAGAQARRFAFGVRTPDQRLVLFRLENQTVRWTSTTLAGELRLLPGFHNGENDFPPDFDFTRSRFNQLRYGGDPTIDERDFNLRCNSSPDSNGSTLSCANGYGLEVFYSRCYVELSGTVMCESRPQ